MRVRIVSEKGTNSSASIALEDGTELRNVMSANIRMEPGEVHTATLTFSMPLIDCDAVATVSEEHLRELATAHGFELVRKE